MCIESNKKEKEIVVVISAMVKTTVPSIFYYFKELISNINVSFQPCPAYCDLYQAVNVVCCHTPNNFFGALIFNSFDRSMSKYLIMTMPVGTLVEKS